MQNMVSLIGLFCESGKRLSHRKRRMRVRKKIARDERLENKRKESKKVHPAYDCHTARDYRVRAETKRGRDKERKRGREE